VFVDAKVEFLFDGTGLAGLREEWVFDGMTSEWMKADYDADKDGAFKAAELKKIESEMFDSLKAERYFHRVVVDGRECPVTGASGFSAAVVKGRVAFRFFVPVRVSGSAKKRSVKLRLEDPSIYTDFVFSKDTPSLAGERQRFSTEFKRSGGAQPDGRYIPETIELRFRKRP